MRERAGIGDVHVKSCRKFELNVDIGRHKQEQQSRSCEQNKREYDRLSSRLAPSKTPMEKLKD